MYKKCPHCEKDNEIYEITEVPALLKCSNCHCTFEYFHDTSKLKDRIKEKQDNSLEDSSKSTALTSNGEEEEQKNYDSKLKIDENSKNIMEIF